jgi:hypothetical protein
MVTKYFLLNWDVDEKFSKTNDFSVFNPGLSVGYLL